MTSKPADPAAGEDARLALERQAIERLDAGAPAASPEEAAARAPYERLIARVREVDDECEPPAGWEDRAVARWRGGRRRRWRNAGIGVIAGLGVAAVLMLRCAGVGGESRRFVIAMTDESGQVRRGEAGTIGDHLKVRVTGADGEIRLLLYRGARRIVGCPGSAGCRREGGALVLEWRFVEAGEYQLAVVTGKLKRELSGEGGIDGDVPAAREAGGRVVLHKVQVSP